MTALRSIAPICSMLACLVALAACPGGADAERAAAADAQGLDAAPDDASEDVAAAIDGAAPQDVPSDAPMDDAAPDAAAPDVAPEVDVPLPSDVPVIIPDAGLLPCDPPLAMVPDATAVEALQLLVLEPQGGTTGDYRFELVTDASGALVDPLTGVYLAGSVPYVTDEIRVTDTGCIGAATLTITIVEPLIVAPLLVEMPPNEDFTIATAGGSDAIDYSVLVNKSGGVVDAGGHYIAGPVPGRDTVRVLDMGTGKSIDITVDVVEGATVQPLQQRLIVATGHPVVPTLLGGSGHFTAQSGDPEVAAVDGDRIWGVGPGNTVIDYLDDFLGFTAALPIEAVAPLSSPILRKGDGSGAAVLVGPGDIDGDGWEDAVLGFLETDLYAVDAGAVLIYRGGPGGMSLGRVIHGSYQGQGLGRAVAVADLDGDGRGDLIATTTNGVALGGTRGAVSVWPGVAGGLFGEEPSFVLEGSIPGAQFGHRVAACDFNGDGLLDLAVAAPALEDYAAQVIAEDQGAVAIHLNGKTGIAPKAEVVLYGQALVGGAWAARPGMGLGAELAAGDMDGDGACDLFVRGSWPDGPDGETSSPAVLIYRGLPLGQGVSGKGGVAKLPSRVLLGAGGGFGASLAAGDVDGDAWADLVIGHTGAGGGAGAVRVLRGGPLPVGPAAKAEETEGDWWFGGLAGGDGLGARVAVGDADGAPPLDVLVSGLDGELAGGEDGAGVVVAFPGTAGGVPSTTPALIVAGEASGDRFGEAAALVGDVDGDGTPDAVVFAGGADALGPDVGLPYLVHGGETPSRAPLELPGAATGSRFGASLDIVGDVDGDGVPDLVVGAPQLPQEMGPLAGAALLYRGTQGGFEHEPAMIFSGFPGHGAADRLGSSVARIGDFDGDGVGDFAVAGSTGDRPASYDPTVYAVIGKCGAKLEDAGVVAVFRGSALGLPSGTPAFLIHGFQAGQGVTTVLGDFDLDDDGRADLLVGGNAWDRGPLKETGGFMIHRGRAANPDGLITVLCDPELKIQGIEPNERMGWGAARIGDLDLDGCDEIAVGSPGEGNHDEELPVIQQGVVRVIWGWGGPLCPEAPEVTILASGEAGAFAGLSMAGGRFIDDDVMPDLIVGAPAHTHNGDVTGGLFVVPGAYLASLPREALIDGELPLAMLPLVPPDAEGVFLYEGEEPLEGFGGALALLPGIGDDGRAVIVVGTPGGAVAGIPQSGGARVFRFDVASLGPLYGADPLPIAEFGGEAACWRSELGASVAAASVAGRALVVVGGDNACGLGVRNGAAYVLDLGAE